MIRKVWDREFEIVKQFSYGEGFGNDISDAAGVYAILEKTRGLYPVYLPVYIGETKNFKKRLVKEHEKYDCWFVKTEKDTLYCGLHVIKPIPGEKEEAAEEYRKEIESYLIQKTNPECNEMS